MNIPEALVQGRVPVGGAHVPIGATYREVFDLIPGFPEAPEYRWEEPEGPGERFVMEAPFLGFPPSRIEFIFVGGKLRQVLSDDPEGKADGLDRDASIRRATEWITAWTSQLGKPTRTFKDRSAIWQFGDVELVAGYEERTPSIGMTVRRTLQLP